MAKGERPKSEKKRTRTAVLLISSGLWLLYFDLLTTMPGCTGTAPGADAATDGQLLSDSSGPDAWLNIPDSSASLPDSSQSFPDSSFSFPDSSASFPDSSTSFPDSSVFFPDSSVRTDSSFADATRFVDASTTF